MGEGFSEIFFVNSDSKLVSKFVVPSSDGGSRLGGRISQTNLAKAATTNLDKPGFKSLRSQLIEKMYVTGIV